MSAPRDILSGEWVNYSYAYPAYFYLICILLGVTGVDYMLKAGEYSVEYYPRRYDEIRTVYAYVPSSLRSSVRENHSKILIIWV